VCDWFSEMWMTVRSNFIRGRGQRSAEKRRVITI